MKPTLTLLLLTIILLSCNKQKNYKCACTLITNEYAVSRPTGKVDTMLYGKKDDVQDWCKERESLYDSSSRYGIYTTFYSADCNIEE